jgi:hypothetical protein
MANTTISGLTELAAIPSQADLAIIVDDVSGTPTTKKIQLKNLLGGWRDMRSSLVAAATGGGAPALAAFGPTGGIKQLSFGVGDSVYLAMHVDHDILPESTCFLHVHWTTNGVKTEAVKWALNYTIAERNDVTPDAFGTETQVLLQQAAAGTAWRHIVTEDTVGFTIPPIDSLIIIELERVANGGTENTDTVFGLFVDIHYQAAMVGTISRAPDFYTAP